MSPSIRYLEGHRVYLRPLEHSDLERCHQWINAPEVRPFLLMIWPMDMKAEQAWFDSLPRGPQPSALMFAIVLREDDRHIGNTSLHAIDWLNRRGESGSMIPDPALRGRGYGAEAKALLLDYLFDTLGLHRVDSQTLAYNEASARHLRNCGFTEEGLLRKAIFRGGEWHDLIQFGILADEWRQVRAKVWERIRAK